jgi:hypothetical protein
MTFFGMALLTAVATALLAVLAVVTAWYARRAFLKQAQEVRAIEQQVSDGQELARQQAELLKIQSGQLELQREQLQDQRKASAKQAEVLELQASELQKSLKDRELRDERLRRSQADRVSAWFGLEKTGGDQWGAWIRNASDLPVTDVRAFFHYVQETQPGAWSAVTSGPPIEIRVMPPQHDRFTEIPVQTRSMVSECNDSTYIVSIEFTDAARKRWRRDLRGALRPRS